MIQADSGGAFNLMTVCVGVRVNDCMVFAADSASSLVLTDAATGQSQIANVYQHGEKVFNLYKGLPIAAMTCGMGNVGRSSIGTLAKELRRRLTAPGSEWTIDRESYTLEEVAHKARRFIFEERYSALNPPPPAPHSLEFWIGGYPSGFDAAPELWKLSLANGVCLAPEEVFVGGECGIVWGGQPEAIGRLVSGFDARLAQVLLNRGMDTTSVDAIVDALQSELQAPLVWDTMPVRDAIELADFMVETTKRYIRFLPGADIVGGETDVAVVTKYEGFKWVRRKHFYSPAMNVLETDHV